MKTYLFPEALRDDFIRYLSTRPFVEVEQAINALRQLQEYVPAPEEPTAPNA